ncbi:MAG TPA: C4-dicarboxylate ABC transporter, partial [Erythrobacter sp.]|nr:C4-dicarboxylate ABC transporter [Erythrobacter sp.]
EANRAPWGVIMMFGGGLALAAGMSASGLADWLGNALLPLEAFPLLLVALAVVAMVVLITEFASNVATATGIIPVIAALVVALGVDPILLAMPAALAASWGFMLPAGTGPNAIA